MRSLYLVLSVLLAILAPPARAQTANIPGFESKYVEANGIRFHYVQGGKGPVMLFLHGYPANWFMWRDQLLEFSKDHTVIAPDTRGISLTSKPKSPDDYKLRTLADDVAAFSEKVVGKDKKIILVGHDWGGVIAWAVPLYHPNLVEKMVIINAPHPTLFARELHINPIQRAGADYIFTNNFEPQKVLDSVGKDGFISMGERIIGPAVKAGIFTEADKEAWMKSWRIPGSLAAGLSYYRANHINPPFNDNHPKGSVPTWVDAKELLAGAPSDIVTTPTLILHGLHDRVVQGGNLSGIEHYAPNSVIKLYNADHWVSVMMPKEINADIRAFVVAKAVKAAKN